MKKEIMLPTEIKAGMVKAFNTTNVSLWNALTFKTDSSFARMLRAAALERGGKLFDGIPSRKEEEILLSMESLNDEDPQVMTQIFSSRVKLVTELASKKYTIYVDGKVKVSEKNLNIPDFILMQQHAAQIAAEIK